MLKQIRLQRKRYQSGLSRGDVKPELLRNPIGKPGGAAIGDRQAAGGDHNRLAAELSARGAQGIACIGAADLEYLSLGQDLDSGPVALGQQQLQYRLAGLVAEQLTRRFFVIVDAVPLHQLHKIGGLEATQGRLAKMGIATEEIGRCVVQVGKVAATTAGHKNFAPNLVGVLQQQDTTAPVSGRSRTHKTGGPCADNDHILFRHASAVLFSGRFRRFARLFLSGSIELANLVGQRTAMTRTLAPCRLVTLNRILGSLSLFMHRFVLFAIFLGALASGFLAGGVSQQLLFLGFALQYSHESADLALFFTATHQLFSPASAAACAAASAAACSASIRLRSHSSTVSKVMGPSLPARSSVSRISDAL